jgi:hypothetical protein
MTRTMMILSLIAVLVTSSQAFASGIVGFPIGPGGSLESTSAGSTVTKAPGKDVVALSDDTTAILSDLPTFSVGTKAETKRIDLPVTPGCASRPEALLVDEAARGLCKY